ncbi:carbamoyltransferase HypF [Microbispora sp. ATCC PTA-5024]|uniref:carbamoyltransferase HypF n=1 Tax=Microbispora sp. ATCC PTA-5024 TaxID=316330 RepID=UPI0003DC9179|nr:carbamoyltransferase HypF [Microbispora sp. ATCC PTA-5024]ETK34077.1 HAD family hydrolase [Microbispora sp. ATCC PTA-5024]
MSSRVRAAIRVEGIVQGVGFRPYVYGLATGLGLDGLVGNDERGVFIEVEGGPGPVGEFLAALRDRPPPLAVIEHISAGTLPATGETGFVIARSATGGDRRALVPPDVATCDDCLREMDDPADRRYRYAFTNCTNCGPRFTIVRDVPYDRPNTTMAGFAMCADCAREYHDPADRRFHAQPVCCPACGPRLRLVDGDGREAPGDPVALAAERLLDGQVLAVKGLGGYHLAAVAGCEQAVAALRSRKHREDKPFAVMAADLAQAGRLCEVGEAAAELLTGRERPIVLLVRRTDAEVAPSAAPGNRRLGVMLPYTPLHHLLLRALGRPVVLTSGNVSDEPIAYRDDEAAGRLGGIADAFLTHDRPIHTRTDDSVIRLFRGRAVPVRRSRGYVPHPLPLAWECPRPVLACGAELKNTFCLAKGSHAFVSHHIGDLENYETSRSFTEGVEHFARLFDVVPEVVAHDLHPEYLSTKYALDRVDADLVGVQHHHAHVASCLADNGVAGPVIGVAFDGLGYGTDGTLWGGEFLVAGLAGFERAGHLATVPMPGGAAAIREPWRMAAAYLDLAFEGDVPASLGVVRRNAARWDAVVALARRGVNAPRTSSAGRLFDAVAAILGVRDAITYEGQAAVELEQRADPAERGTYPCPVTSEAPSGPPFAVPGTALVRAVVDDLCAGADPSVVAARFHNAVAGLVADGCDRVRAATGLSAVALSGGVFQNLLLLERAAGLLERRGFHVLLHHRVPPNDGGVSLGQAAVAAALDRERRWGCA